MSGPKKDGELMNCCTATGSTSFLDQYRSVNGGSNQYTSCYDPSDIDSGACTKDRNGNSLYACFPGSDQIANCRSSCLNGHPQDPVFKLNDSSANAELPIAERGVELYENYGLDTNIRSDSGLYGDNRNIFSCIGDLGRKVSLYGNITFSIMTNTIRVGSDLANTTPLSVGTVKVLQLGAPDIYYTIAYAPSGSRYPYFGNHGVVFHYGGNSYPYIIGQIEDLPEVGIGYDATGGGGNYTYYISATAMMKRLFGMSSSSTITPESLRVVDGNINDPVTYPYTDSKCGGWNFVTGPAAAAPFPLPWTHSYYLSYPSGSNLDRQAWNCAVGSNKLGDVSKPGCYGSGVKSIYIPPHMGITRVGYYKPTYSTDDSVNGNPGQIIASTQMWTDTTVYSSDSMYFNGVFPAVGPTSLPPYSTAVNSNRNSTFNMTAGSIYSVTVCVRQDDAFYNKYVKPANGKFAPEIFLIPGISNAAGFPGQLTPYGISNKLGNPLQLMTAPNKYWTSSNPYWTSGVVKLNTSFNPGDVIYGPADDPPLPGSKPHNHIFFRKNGSVGCNSSDSLLAVDPTSKTLKSKIIRKITNLVASDKAMLDLLTGKIKNVAYDGARGLGFDITATPPTGKYRIESFDVINGVFSVEWLYVIYYCAMNNRNLVQWNAGTQQYENVNCNPNSSNTCGSECLLYRDDYTYANYTTVPASPCDTAMQAYCGMRNLSAIYGTWQETASIFTNECSCISQQQFCPAQFNNGCTVSPSNTTRYVSAQMQECLGAAICNYCSITVNQILLSLSGCTDNKNILKNFGTTCGNADCTYNITPPDDGGDGDGSGSTSGDGGSTGNSGDGSGTPSTGSTSWIVILLVVMFVIAILIGGIFISKKYFFKK